MTEQKNFESLKSMDDANVKLKDRFYHKFSYNR